LVEYFFKTFGTVTILCVKMRLKIGNDEEHLAAIAQVIAECDGKPDMLWESHTVILSTDYLLNFQVVTSIMPKIVFLYLSTAYYVMGYLLNSSSSKETQIQPFTVVSFMGI
jgi:hypothetical protein